MKRQNPAWHREPVFHAMPIGAWAMFAAHLRATALAQPEPVRAVIRPRPSAIAFGLVVAVVAFAVAMAASRSIGSTIRDSMDASASIDQAVTFDLGRTVCGDCCIGKLWRAIGSHPGVRDIEARAGARTFLVHYEARATDPARLLTALVAAGETTVSLAPADFAVAVKQWASTARR